MVGKYHEDVGWYFTRKFEEKVDLAGDDKWTIVPIGATRVGTL